MTHINDDISIKTLIGSGTFIKGDLSVKGFLRFDGDIDGDIETTGRIIIGEQARVRGNIKATAAIIHGIVEGDTVVADGVRVFSTAIILGDIVSKKIVLEENVFLQGQCIVLENELAFEKAKQIRQDEKAIREKTLFINKGSN